MGKYYVLYIRESACKKVQEFLQLDCKKKEQYIAALLFINL